MGELLYLKETDDKDMVLEENPGDKNENVRCSQSMKVIFKKQSTS